MTANYLVDSHCHINFNDFLDDVNETVTRANDNGVKSILIVSVDRAGLDSIVKIIEKYPNIFGTVGVHPNLNPGEEQEITLDEIKWHSKHPKIVGIGETGLDYYRDTNTAPHQTNRFRLHIEAAKSVQLPLVVHTRNAKEDTIKILTEENARECGGVMHCFTEDWSMAKKALDLGFYISISGIVTFKKSDNLRDVSKRIPLNRLLIETDSPYLAPSPRRGKRNEPSYVVHTAKFLANLRGESYEMFAESTTNNFFALFPKATESVI